jgi:monoamine oxidase
MINQKNELSKRDFLQALGLIGGSAVMYTAMQGLDMAHASAMTSPPKLSTDGNGKKLLILGAGLSGLTTAIEMTKKGYDCQIIEARAFAGGRCQSARKGTVIEELDGERQVCNFENNQYLNIGPWRIPAEHRAVIHYCKVLGVKLEPMINKSVHAYYYSEEVDGPLKGKRIRQVDMDIDRAGNVTELLAKVVKQGALDDDFSAQDKERLLEYLGSTGLLDQKELTYRANRARGYEKCAA